MKNILLILLLGLFLISCGEERKSWSEAISTPIPTATSAPIPTATSTLIPTATSVPESNSSDIHIKRLSELKVSNHSNSSIPKYNRSEWNHWSDDDGDCINTRHEVLISESTKDLIMKDKCNVATGNWIGLFTNQIIKEAKLLDVDHMVPLANAHYSGGWAWNKEQKKLFANYLGFSEHLIAVSSSSNRSKGASGPEKWLPDNELYLCDYASNWISIKHTWDLSITSEEKNALSNIVNKCS